MRAPTCQSRSQHTVDKDLVAYRACETGFDNKTLAARRETQVPVQFSVRSITEYVAQPLDFRADDSPLIEFCSRRFGQVGVLDHAALDQDADHVLQHPHQS